MMRLPVTRVWPWAPHRPSRTCGCLALAALLPSRPCAAQPRPPIRALRAVVATAPEPLASIAGIRELPGGRVLVNDLTSRRVVLLDSTLRLARIVADTTPATGNAYRGQFGGIIPYRGDSTLFVDPQTLSMSVLDAAGRIVRTLATPRPGDAMMLTGGVAGNPGFDAQGRLVYRAPPTRARPIVDEDGGFTMPPQPDSAPLVRVRLGTRQLDTVTFVRVPARRLSVTRTGRGRSRLTVVVHPLPVVDDWAVLSDGTVAVLRGRDYHLDALTPAGRRVAGPHVPFDWERLDEERKARIIDSVAAALRRNASQSPALVGTALALEAPGRTAPQAPMPRAGSATVEQVPVQPAELPDYRPAFAAGGVRADLDGRLWVRTIATRPASGPVYDVLDRTGRLVDRLLLPPGTAVAGFGRGVVFLGTRDADGVHLHRARLP